MQFNLIGIVTAIVIPIAQPIRFDTNGSILALNMVIRTSHILIFASLKRLIGSTVILAIIDTITHLAIGNTPEIVTGELARCATLVITILFIRAITTVIFMVAFPSIENPPAIGAPELGGFASMRGTVSSVFIGVIPTIIITIASPKSIDTFPIST